MDSKLVPKARARLARATCLALWLGGFLGPISPASAADATAAPNLDQVLTPERLAAVRAIDEIATSPDGRFVAFTRTVPRRPGVDEDGEPWTELWVLDLPEGRERPFVTGKVNVQRIAWTPNGRQLGFLAKRGDDETRALYLIPIDGGEARKALALASDLSDYSFSPDGERVAGLAAEPEDEAAKKLKDKGFKQQIVEEDWRFVRLWMGRLFEPAPTNFVLAITGSVRQVHWSPVDNRLAIAVTPTPSVDDGMMRQQVRVVDADSGTELAAVDHAAKLGAFGWSPDGTQLALIAGEDLHDPSAGRLLTVPATGGKPQDLVPGFEGEITRFAWSGNRELVFIAARGVLSTLSRITVGGAVAGDAVTNLLGPGRPILTGLSQAWNGGLIAVMGHAARHPAELFTFEAGDRELARRTDSNPGLADLRWARQDALRYRARDGLDLEGILIHPLDARENTRYPLILAVHGGPEAHVSDGWVTSYSNPGQAAAARGFAVFYPNYRGSTGRGVTFTKLGQGDPAGREFDDLVDAVDHLIGTGLVDRQRVGVTGGSYGGYATAWCATRFSDRFAAGVMFVGISDNLSKVGTTDIPDEEYLVHSRRRPWEMWETLLQRSPIFHAAQARTPLLILHGADDPRVHPGQSKEMYRHLKMHGRAPTRLVLYPGEGHGNRKAAARFDYQLRMLQWFEHYLKQANPGPPPPRAIEYGLPGPDAR